jgi:hypothetical protein
MNLAEVLLERAFIARRSPTTLRNYTYQARYLAARGIVAAEDATEEKVRRFVDERLAEIEPQSVAQSLIALFAIVSHLELSARFPMERIRRLYRLRPHVTPPLARELVDCLRRADRSRREGAWSFPRGLRAVLCGHRRSLQPGVRSAGGLSRR